MKLQQLVKELSIELNQSKYKLQSAAILETSDLTDSTSTELSREQLDKIVIYFNILIFKNIFIYLIFLATC